MKKTPKTLELDPPTPAEEVGYWRVSTSRDQTPDMQKALMLQRGIPEANIFGDMASGRKAKRPGLEKALRLMAGRPGWSLVVWRLDRLGRDTIELLKLMQEFEAEGWNFISMTESVDTRTAMGKAFIGMLAVFAQFESDSGRERTRAGMARARENGSQIGKNTRYTLKQFETMERLILSKRAHPLSLGRIAARFKMSTPNLRYHFPDWRSLTKKERDAWRKAHPLPVKRRD